MPAVFNKLREKLGAGGGSPPPNHQPTNKDDTLIKYGFWLAFTGLVLAFFLGGGLIIMGKVEVKDLATAVDPFIGVVGGLAGGLFGAHIHSHGLEKARQDPLYNKLQELTPKQREQVEKFIAQVKSSVQ